MCNRLAFAICLYLSSASVLIHKKTATFFFQEVQKESKVILVAIAICNYFGITTWNYFGITTCNYFWIATCNYCQRYQSTFTTPRHIFEAATATCLLISKTVKANWLKLKFAGTITKGIRLISNDRERERDNKKELYKMVVLQSNGMVWNIFQLWWAKNNPQSSNPGRQPLGQDLLTQSKKMIL